MQKGWKTEELSESEILEMANRYPQLDVRVLVGGDIIVRSKKDSWLIRDEVRFLTLYHKALIFEKGKVREKYHVQDIFYDLEFIFASIVSHDNYSLGIKRADIDGILEIIEQSKSN